MINYVYSIILYVHVILYMRLQNIFCLLEICDSERNEENVEVSIQSVTLFSWTRLNEPMLDLTESSLVLFGLVVVSVQSKVLCHHQMSLYISTYFHNNYIMRIVYMFMHNNQLIQRPFFPKTGFAVCLGLST